MRLFVDFQDMPNIHCTGAHAMVAVVNIDGLVRVRCRLNFNWKHHVGYVVGASLILNS